MIKKDTWVEIHKVLLNPHERPEHIPADTKRVPFEMRVKGKLLQDAEIGDQVRIETETKRIESGILIKMNPSYTHHFGTYVDSVKKMKDIILSEMEDIDHD